MGENVKPVTELTDRELLEEVATGFRETRDLLKGAGAALSSNPMLGRMFGGLAGALG